MSKDKNTSCLGLIVSILVIAIIAGIVIGPKGCSRRYESWKASSYGSDWLIVQYAQDGSIINNWELYNKSVGNEENSDGIFFLDDESNVVHISGHYTYIQIIDDKWDKAKERFLKIPIEDDE